ncbi:MAG: succinate dehydrogenase, hydrophobic membrane anchor protein [Alphaproteobacteria bacterium]|nr:succinate dehydrogenase, hydrophobic membrane anchor protein [Alphaproteobacteria bacterium]
MSEHSLRTALGRVSGLGSAKDGTQHWWQQRLSALALLPLAVWFALSVAGLAGAEHAQVKAWVASPVVAVLLLLFVLSGFYHLRLGLQVVIEDYVHAPGAKLALLVLNVFACAGVGLAAAVAVLSLHFRG